MASRPPVDVRRAQDRYRTAASGRLCRHSFAFGPHYDPDNVSYGVLLLHDDHRLAPGSGFPLHRHRDVEVVTWVLTGALVHTDAAAGRRVVVPGSVQRMSAGRGVEHSETNDAHRGGGPHPPEPLRFVQMWVAPDTGGGDPGYEQSDVSGALAGGALVPVASGRSAHEGGPGVRLGNRHAALHAARLPAGGSTALPEAPFLHVFVARGSLLLDGAEPLGEGDAARLTGGGGQRVTAAEPAEVLVWEMHADLRGTA